MTQVQNRQELIDLKILLKKCCIAESELACFLLDKASATDLPIDDTFKLKWLTDRVKVLIRRIQASDERYHNDSSDENVPMPCTRRVYETGSSDILCPKGHSFVEKEKKRRGGSEK